MHVARSRAFDRLAWKGPALAVLGLLLVTLAGPATAIGHPIVQPVDSPGASTERYTIAVPSEKAVATVRVEIQFPRGLQVTQLEAPPGWRVMAETSGGQILGAVWDGGSIPSGQFATFGVLAQTPNGPTELAWAVIQTYEDGTEIQWTGPDSAQFPATRTRIQAAATLSPSEVLAAVAVVAAVVGLTVAALAWRRVRSGSDKHAPT